MLKSFKNVLLKDELDLPLSEIQKRMELGKIFAECFPKEIFENLSVLQPSVGCLNRCSFCSQESGNLLRMIDGESVRTLAGALRYAMDLLHISYLTCCKKYKPGVIFPYLDNDIGSYVYLRDYLIAMDSLGVKVRTSTIGWSRKNEELNEMHRTIVKSYSHILAGVRFSLTSYSAGWITNRDEFLLDFINAISIYKNMLGLKDHEGNSGACIDIDFKPDIIPCCIRVHQAEGKRMIYGQGYCMISDFQSPDSEAWMFAGNEDRSDMLKKVQNLIHAQGTESLQLRHGKLSCLENEDGVYYGFYPDESVHETDGIFFFPQTQKRRGGILNACWPLREFEDYIKNKDFRMESFEDAMRICSKFVSCTDYGERRGTHLKNTFFPMFDALCKILSTLNLPPDTVFDRAIIRDRGIIRNSGRAFYEFRDLASSPNVMVVPDRLMCEGRDEEVWRIFPTMIFDSNKTVASIGKKSQVELDDSGSTDPCGGTWIMAWKVDAPSHSHKKPDGSPREEYYLSVSDYMKPMQMFDQKVGKKALLMPGV